MIVDVITIFPKMFSPVFGESIIKRAQAKGLIKINIHNLREYTDNPHKKVDFSSCGGGGMVFSPQPFFSCVESVLNCKKYSKKKKNAKNRIILLSPKGKTLNQNLVKKFLKYERLIVLASRYEGVDERVRQHLADEEISIGDYVLSGGELPAMVFLDCLIRLIPGVVSNKESIKKESFENNLLDFPHYTRPVNFRGMKVPEILFSGNHKEIEDWRRNQAISLTKKRRPDLFKK